MEKKDILQRIELQTKLLASNPFIGKKFSALSISLGKKTNFVISSNIFT